MEQKIWYFGFRFEKDLHDRIKSHCKQESLSQNLLIIQAFQFAKELHNKENILFDRQSGFRARTNINDMIETMFVHTDEQRESVRTFAFAYRLSMSEVLRIALEVYLDHFDARNGNLDIEKHI